MSYRAEISFKQIAPENVFAFLKEFKDWVKRYYDFSTWDKIDLFKEVARKWQEFTDEGVRERLTLDESDDLQYHRRSSCYNEIWNNYLEQSL